MNFKFSKYALASQKPSPVNKMTESFSYDFRPGVDINLGVGYVNDSTMPQENLKCSFNSVLNNSNKYRSPLNYGAAKGSVNLIQSVKDYYSNNRIGGFTKELIDDKKIIIGANGATSILEALADVMEPGVVITADPMYYIYTETLLRKGFTLLTIPEDDNGIQTDVLEQKLEGIDLNSISFLYIVTVNNPSTTIVSNARRRELVRITNQLCHATRKLIPLVFDKAYEDIIYDKDVEKPISGLLYDDFSNVIEIGTFSKIIAPALRIGYAIGDKSELMNLLIQKISDVGFSSSLIMQEVTSHFLDNYIEEHSLMVKTAYMQKAEYLVSLIKDNIGGFIKHISGGKAGFYFYITFKNVETHTKSNFYKFLSRKTGDLNIDGKIEMNPRLVYVPGEFCVNQLGDIAELSKYQLRLSFGFSDLPELKKAIFLVKEAIDYSLSIKK